MGRLTKDYLLVRLWEVAFDYASNVNYVRLYMCMWVCVCGGGGGGGLCVCVCVCVCVSMSMFVPCVCLNELFLSCLLDHLERIKQGTCGDKSIKRKLTQKCTDAYNNPKNVHLRHQGNQ